jgi:hypothetical protein
MQKYTTTSYTILFIHWMKIFPSCMQLYDCCCAVLINCISGAISYMFMSNISFPH